MNKVQRMRDREAHIAYAPLVGTLGGIPDDDWKDIHTEMVVVGTLDGTLDEESSIAASEVKYHRCSTAE